MSDAERDQAEEHAIGEVVERELPRSVDDLPPMDFSTLIVSLRTSVLLHLGQGGQEVELPLARQEVDLLGVLEHKTRGNLTGEEERLLSQILFELRTRYLAVCGQKEP